MQMHSWLSYWRKTLSGRQKSESLIYAGDLLTMSDIAIRVENLSKRYRIGGPQARYKTIRETLVETARAPFRWLDCLPSRGFGRNLREEMVVR